ncbi:MAG: hypothetical protein ACR2NU_04015 [Aeoliella sp.]
MATTLAFPAANSAPTRNTFWVLRCAVALVAVVAWVLVLSQLALMVRAEMRLGQIVREANVFAGLPDVQAADLHEFVSRRTKRAGWKHARVLIVPSGTGAHQGVRIEIPAADAMPRFMRPWVPFSRTATRSVITSSRARNTWWSG